MGIRDLFSSRDRSDDRSGGASGSGQDLPRGDEPGASTTPSDDGRGTIGLGDRLGGAAPDTNQGKAEPMPPTPGHPDPVGTEPHTDPPSVPELGDMSAGMALSQVASPPELVGRRRRTTAASSGTHAPVDVSPGRAGTDADRAGTGDAEVPAGSTGTAAGPGLVGSQTSGTARRANGQQGTTPEGEYLDSDLGLAAERMRPGGGPDQTGAPEVHPGDSQGVEVPHELVAEGTSEEQGVVHGVKDPAPQDRADRGDG